MQPRMRLGEIFVELGILSQKTVERILVRAEKTGKRFGTIIEELELITGEELANALALQYGCKVVKNLDTLKIPAELLAVVPVNTALSYHIIPLRIDKGHLAMAMADPTNMQFLGNLAANNNLKIVPFVAPKNEIYSAICRHYLGKAPAEQNQRTVLIAEEDKTLLTMLQDLLAKAGYRVVKAHDGMEAFKAVISEKPHVIITEKEMPKIGGYGLLEAVRNVPETMFVPVILVAGKTTTADEEVKAFDKGFFDVVIKPIQPLSLLSRVKRAFYFYEHQYRLY